MPPEEQAAGDQPNGQQENGNKPDGKYNPSTVEDALKVIAALEKRLNERDTDLEKYKRDLSSYTTAQRKQLEEQGKFKELAEQNAAEVARLKAFEEKATSLEAIIRASNEERMKAIPDNKKSLVPVDDLSPDKLQKYLNNNPSLFTKDPAPDYNAGAGAGGSGGRGEPKLSAEELELAAKMGMKPEDYQKAKAGLPKTNS